MDDDTGRSRRRFLQTGAALGTAALAGCSALPGVGKDRPADAVTLSDFRGSGPMVSSRPDLSGTSVEDLPDLSGELTLYMGGGEGGLYLDLIDLFQQMYPDFEVQTKLAPTAQLANTIVTEMEAGQSPADVFLAIDAGSLGVVSQAGYAKTLPSKVLDPVPNAYQDSEKKWVGVAGRARSIPYNTNVFSESDVPEDVFAFAQEPRFEGKMGWAPTYGAFQSFVTAMRVMRGRKETKQWLNGMQAQNVTEYPDEFLASNAVADGEIGAAFANHYYVLRVQAARPEAPIALSFTKNDAGALVNVSGAEVIEGTQNEELATNFVDHLLTREAQEFFATRTFAYPMIPGVPPVGELPRIDELHPPDFDLEKLANMEPTIELMRETGVIS